MSRSETEVGLLASEGDVGEKGVGHGVELRAQRSHLLLEREVLGCQSTIGIGEREVSPYGACKSEDIA